MTGALIPKGTSCRVSPPPPIPTAMSTATTVQTSTTRNTKIYTKIYTQFPSPSQNCCDCAQLLSRSVVSRGIGRNRDLAGWGKWGRPHRRGPYVLA